MAKEFVRHAEAGKPRAHDIVWCRWPFDDDTPPGFKHRPGLVRATYRRRSDQMILVEVTYGTSSTDYEAGAWFGLSNLADMNHAGLYRPTRFDIGRTLRLPWTTEYFEVRPDGVGPTIGRLPQAKIWELESLVTYLKKHGQLE